LIVQGEAIHVTAIKKQSYRSRSCGGTFSTPSVLATDRSTANKYAATQAPEPTDERKKSLENYDAHLKRCDTLVCPGTVKRECEQFCAAMSTGCEALRKGDDAAAAEFLRRAQEYKDQAKKN
jgi:hypothetical protein